jgi:diphthamide synthase (EF-2-diphthine--ammonia ligase)
MRAVIERARSEGVQAFAFGDLYLQDIRTYREQQLVGTGIKPLFPLWGTPADTPTLARTMIAPGLRAVLARILTSRHTKEAIRTRHDRKAYSEGPV